MSNKTQLNIQFDTEHFACLSAYASVLSQRGNKKVTVHELIRQMVFEKLDHMRREIAMHFENNAEYTRALEFVHRDEVKKIKEQLAPILQDRQLIIKFKKSGRFDNEYICDSANDDIVTWRTISMCLWMFAHERDDNNKTKVDRNNEPILETIDTRIIGRRMIGAMYWEIHGREMDQRKWSKEQFFKYETKTSVTDFIDQGKVIIIEIE